MIQMQTKITGDKVVMAAMKRLEKKFPKALKTIVTKSVLVAEKEAKKRAKVKTGRLRASITHTMAGGVGNKQVTFKNRLTKESNVVSGIGAPGGGGIQGIVGSNVKYAPKIEFNVKPFLFPAFKLATKFMVKLLHTDIKRLRP